MISDGICSHAAQRDLEVPPGQKGSKMNFVLAIVNAINCGTGLIIEWTTVFPAFLRIVFCALFF